MLLFQRVDRRLGLTKSLAKRLPDGRDPDKIEHPLESMLRQRIDGLPLGYEDLDDQDSLGKDLLWQTAAERERRAGQQRDFVPAREPGGTQGSQADA